MTQAELKIRTELLNLHKRRLELLEAFEQATGFDVDRITYQLVVLEAVTQAKHKELEVVQRDQNISESKRLCGENVNKSKAIAAYQRAINLLVKERRDDHVRLS